MRHPRSILCVPGFRADWIEKARASNLYGADQLLLDLEDSVPSTRKEEARETVSAHMTPADAVRINRPFTPEADRDMDALEFFPGAIWVPKVEGVGSVNVVYDRRRRGPIVACAESPRGVLCRLLDSVLRHDGDGAAPLAGLAFGRHDFIASAGISPWQTGVIDHAAAHVALAAMARGVPCWMAPSYEAEDSSKVWHEAKRALELGYTGMGCIAPWQVPVVNACFGGEEHEASPRWSDRRRALRLLAAARKDPTKAVFRTEDGDLVSPPTVAWARRVLG